MIFYNEKTQDWGFHALEAMYTDSSTGESQVRIEFVTNRRYLEERVRQWPHLAELVIRELAPTPEQSSRLNDINAADIEMHQEAYVMQYVQYGYIDAPLTPEGTAVDTGHTYLNTLISRPLNAQRRLVRAREMLRADVAHLRWKKETAGMVVNNLLFGTSDREKALLASKVVAAMNLPGATHKYKTAQGWVTLSSSVMIQLGLLMVQYVQDCFDKEGDLVDAINQSTDLNTLDIRDGWPTNEFTVDLSGE